MCQERIDLDQLGVSTEIVRKDPSEVVEMSRDGAYITGLYLEGARWNMSAMRLEEALPKEMFSALPVVHLRPLLLNKVPVSGMAHIPVFRTQARGDTFVFTAQLRTKDEVAKWVLAGVVLVMEIR